MKVVSGIRADRVAFGAGNVLFVEGKDSSLDVSVLGRILPIDVKPLGASFALRGAAEAFAAVCPTYYFIIDRDHAADGTVERYWRDFPSAETPNLLLWRKKELESYFLDPDYLMQSEWFDGRHRDRRDIESLLLKVANRILYISAANYVITKVRETLKQKWISQFTDDRKFKDADSAKGMLLSMSEFGEFESKVSNVVRREELCRDFDEILQDLTGGSEPLRWGCGRWLDLLPAKDMFATVLQSSCFKVKGSGGKCLTGENKTRTVVESLLVEGVRLPSDFVQLREILNVRALSARGAVK